MSKTIRARQQANDDDDNDEDKHKDVDTHKMLRCRYPARSVSLSMCVFFVLGSAYLTESREQMAGALGSAAQPAPDAGQDSSRPFPPTPRGLPGSCCGSPECIARQTSDMRERYCCRRLNTLYCPHCGQWLPQHRQRGLRLWTKGQWDNMSPMARDGITVGCKPCAAANEQEEAARMKQNLEARELLRQQPRGGEACSRMDHD